MTGPKTNEREGTRAVLRSSGVPANKMRQVIDLIRNQPVGLAREILRFSDRAAAREVAKLLDSAIANAETNDNLDPDELFVSACYADEGRTLKRFRPRARGRASRIRKRSCSATIIVSRLPEDRLARLRAKQQLTDVASRRRRVERGRTRTKSDTADSNVDVPETDLPTNEDVNDLDVEPTSEAVAEQPSETVEEAELAASDVEPAAGEGAEEEPDTATDQDGAPTDSAAHKEGN